uniref:Uncharacterized protein n=1 Tax=Arundo donax TaxID=35708 RepID=A0A0A9BAR6_ARUDO
MLSIMHHQSSQEKHSALLNFNHTFSMSLGSETSPPYSPLPP